MHDYLSGEQTERILTGGETALKVWREKRGLSLAAVATAAHVTAEALADLEAGHGSLEEGLLRKLAAALDVSPSSIEREVDED